ncbi:hypothetical protein F5Y16DRAFT_176355 [Xylariaceae sp. FL0255]|nr:hypothetical protein F5Y16DRAFT_176355 [Xylariaceae sp. FL0255]
MIWITAAVASLLATQVYGSSEGNFLGVERSYLEGRTEELAYNTIYRRQSTTTSSNTTADWDTETAAACKSSLSGLSGASNPSGIAMCYNLAQLDTTTGAFKADMRLYQVSTPSGNWAGIEPQEMTGGITYTGSTASEINGQPASTTNITARSLNKRQTPTPLRTYTIVGQINKEEMNQPMTITVIEPLVMPTLTLSAVSTSGQSLNATVSSNEAAFVNGIFSKEVVLSSENLATIAVDNATVALANGTIAFVLPGVNLLIFPTGLVITGSWAVLGIAMYAFCSFERYNYRESYRRRKAMTGAKSYMSRI